MKKVLVVAALFGMSSMAFASQTFVASKTSCAEVQSALKADGAVALETWLGTNEYVASPADCAFGQVAISAVEKTNDTWFCSVGYVCKADHVR